MALRMLDLFCGRFGWSRAFAARGWRCVGIDMVDPPELPDNCQFVQADILWLHFDLLRGWWVERGNDIQMLGEFDFVCASSPCQQFAVWGMPHFWPNPKYPKTGIRLFNHTREMCEDSGVPYVMENVRAAQKFVGNGGHACGPFILWGSGVPPILPQGINKGMSQQRDENGRRRGALEHVSKKERAAQGATIPPELANCVADYAERLLEQAAAEREGFILIPKGE